MNTLHIRTLYLLLILFVTSCNGDIFVDDDTPPSASALEVADGGEASLTFGTEHLDYILLLLPELEPDSDDLGMRWRDKLLDDYPSYDKNDYKYRAVRYLASGETEHHNLDATYINFKKYEDSDNPTQRLRVWNSVLELELVREKKGKLTVRNVRNFSNDFLDCDINLCYSYKDEIVGLSLAPSFGDGRPYEVVGIEYEKDCRILTEHGTDSVMISVDNPGTEELRYEFPIAEHCRLYVDYGLNPRLGLKLDGAGGFPEVGIPTFRNEEVDGIVLVEGCFHGEKVPFSTGRIEVPGLASALPDFVTAGFNKVYTFIVPSGVGVRAKFYVSRLVFHTIGSLRIRNPRDGRELTVPVKVKVSQPWNYYMKWNKVDL